MSGWRYGIIRKVFADPEQDKWFAEIETFKLSSRQPPYLIDSTGYVTVELASYSTELIAHAAAVGMVGMRISQYTEMWLSGFRFIAKRIDASRVELPP